MTAPLVAALALSAVHFLTPRLRFLTNAPRSVSLSLAGGASIAYVFLHLLPEIAHGDALLEAETGETAFGIWAVALASLLGFYGIERMVQSEHMRTTHRGHRARPGVFRVHLASFAAYNLVTGYLLVHRVREDADAAGLAVFATAMALHLLITDHGLLEAFRAGYLRIGRWLLTAALLSGWAVGAATELPEHWIALVMAALGGGVILNVLKEELPKERESRFRALLLGAAVFAGLL